MLPAGRHHCRCFIPKSSALEDGRNYHPKHVEMIKISNKTIITQLSITTHAKFQRHRLKFIKNHLKTPTCFGLRPSSGSYNVLAKITIIIDHSWMFLC